MKITLLIVMVLCIGATSSTETHGDTRCSNYEIISKQITMEIRLDNLENRLANLGQNEVRKSCDDGWIGFQSSCYLFATINVEFEPAESLCKIYDSHLVSIRDSRENDFIKSQVAELAADKFWIGMIDDYVEGSWIWIDRNDDVQFYNWGKGEPNQKRDANCAAIWHTFDNNYVDAPCTDVQFRPICKKDMA